MKLTILFLFAGLLQLSASVYSQNTKLRFDLKNVRVIDVLEEIEGQSEFRFAYSSKYIDLDRRVTVSADNKRIQDVLHQLFDDTGVAFTVTDRHILLIPGEMVSESVSGQQPAAVSGKVTDNKGLPLPGVTVVIKGTTTGTITNIDGQFSLSNVPDNGILVFSFVGMKTQEIPVAGKVAFDVVLEELIFGVDEVVVTALGIKREEKALGYAVQAVSGEGLQTVKGIDVGTSLTGKVSGMLVKNSPEFTAEPVIEIRGENPLLVIDGVPYGNMRLRDIPSDDIESISVLKGATASALYGYRGASGAIMITTYRGSAQKGLSVSANSSTMFTAGYLAIPELQSTYGRVLKTNTDGSLQYVQSGDGSWGSPMEGQTVIQWDPVSKSMQPMPYLPIGKDNFKNFLQQGYILNNNVNLVQQGEFGSLRSSVSWVQNKGQYPNSRFDKLTYSIGGEMKLNKFTLSSNASYNKQVTPNKGFSGYTGYDPMYGLLIWSATDWDIRQYKDYWVVPNEVQNSSYTAGNNNPWFDRNERTHAVNKDIFNGTLSATYDFTSWLKGTLRVGYDTYSDRQDIQVSKGSFQGAGSARLIPNGTEVWGESQKGSYNLGLSRGYSINNDLIFTGNHTFLRDFTVDGLVGASLFYGQDEGIETRTRGGISIPGFYSLKASIDPVLVASLLYRRQVNSLYGRLGVSWKNFIFAEATLRNDWVSTLPETTRSYAYPSVSGSLILSEILPRNNWLSLWKLRGSWVTVKNPAAIYAINSVFSITNNAWGTLSSATLPTTIRGTDVLPEASETFEVGTVANFLKNKASIDLTYYSKRMFDFLRSTGISPASGFSNNFINTDEEITRRGVELTLNGTPVKTENVKWDLSVNWSKFARYFTRLDSLYSADRLWVKVGERADPFVLRDFLKDPDGNIIHNTSGLPLFAGYDSKYGNTDPDWIWGFSTSLKYKNMVLSASLDGRVGGLAQSITEMYMWRSGGHPNSLTPERYLDATKGTKNYIGEGVKVASGTVTYDTYGRITNDTRVFAPNDVATTYKSYIETLHKGTAWGGAPSPTEAYETTFLKIREMSLTWFLPDEVSSKIGARNVSLSAVGQNLLYRAKQFKYSDIDGGSENFVDPSQRYIGLNLKLNF